MSIISKYADQESVSSTLEAYKRSSDELETGLHKLVYEVASQHGLKLYSIFIHGSRHIAQMVFEESGINAAVVATTKSYSPRSNKTELVYLYRSPTIKKAKGASNSSTSERESTKIKSLLAAISKNKEAPKQKDIQELMSRGMRYAIKSISSGQSSSPSLSLDRELAESVTKFVLGIDTYVPTAYIEELKEKYSSYTTEKEKKANAEEVIQRYAAGSTAVCICTPREYPRGLYYCVADVTYDVKKDEPVFQTDLKFYKTLQESPIASTAMMIKTFMQGQGIKYDPTNDLGISARDFYFPDLDISCGYSTSEFFWILIPKTAP